MRIKHKTLKSITTSASVGRIVIDEHGFSEVSAQQARFLTQPGMGFEAVDPIPPEELEPEEPVDEEDGEEEEGEDGGSVAPPPVAPAPEQPYSDDSIQPSVQLGESVNVAASVETAPPAPASTAPATPKAKAKKKNR